MAVMKFAQLEHTKMLFPAAEMVPSHPTDPVELRRLHYQTPGTTFTQDIILSIDQSNYKLMMMLESYTGESSLW